MTGVPGGGQIRNNQSFGGSIDYGDGGFMGGFLHSGAAVDKVREIVLATDPAKVKTAGETYTAVAKRMQQTITTVYDQANAMSDAWGGKDSEAAMRQMQKMYDQAYEIHDKSTTTGSALTDHGVKLQWYKDHVPGGGAVNGMSGGEAVLGAVSPVGLAIKDSIFGSSDDDAAKEFMKRLQGRTTEANDAFPEGIRSDQAYASQQIQAHDQPAPHGWWASSPFWRRWRWPPAEGPVRRSEAPRNAPSQGPVRQRRPTRHQSAARPVRPQRTRHRRRPLQAGRIRSVRRSRWGRWRRSGRRWPRR